MRRHQTARSTPDGADADVLTCERNCSTSSTLQRRMKRKCFQRGSAAAATYCRRRASWVMNSHASKDRFESQSMNCRKKLSVFVLHSRSPFSPASEGAPEDTPGESHEGQIKPDHCVGFWPDRRPRLLVVSINDPAVAGYPRGYIRQELVVGGGLPARLPEERVQLNHR